MIIPFLTPFDRLWQRLVWGTGLLLVFIGVCTMMFGYEEAEEGKAEHVPPIGVILCIIGMIMLLIGLIIGIDKLDGFEYNWRGEATHTYSDW